MTSPFRPSVGKPNLVVQVISILAQTLIAKREKFPRPGGRFGWAAGQMPNV